MRQEISELHEADAEGNPTGGHTMGVGIDIQWQDGPLGRGGERADPNGAFVEGVIAAAVGRLKFYQRSRFACSENAGAINDLESALERLDSRTAGREARGVEGLHKV